LKLAGGSATGGGIGERNAIGEGNAIAWVHPFMLAFLALLPRGLVTFFDALAALLRFFANGTADPPASQVPVPATALLGWSLTAFQLASAALLADLGLEWHRGNDRREHEAQSRERQGLRLGRED